MSNECLKWDNVLIHIGLPRCGSTYLQELFFPSLPVDIFDNWGCDRHRLNNEVYESLRSREFDKDVFIKWINKKTSKTSGTLVISQETLGWDEVADITANNLYNAFPNGEILIIIREQFSFLSSNYCYKVTSGCFHETKTFTEYLEFYGQFFNLLEYDRLVNYYQNLFGKERVHVLPVEMLRREPELFQSSILKILNFDQTININSNGGKVNRSYSSERIINIMLGINRIFACFYDIFRKLNPSIYWDNKFRYGYYHLKVPISNILGKMFKKENSFFIDYCKEAKPDLIKKFARSNNSLKQLIDIPIEDYDYLIS